MVNAGFASVATTVKVYVSPSPMDGLVGKPENTGGIVELEGADIHGEGPSGAGEPCASLSRSGQGLLRAGIDGQGGVASVDGGAAGQERDGLSRSAVICEWAHVRIDERIGAGGAESDYPESRW